MVMVAAVAAAQTSSPAGSATGGSTAAGDKGATTGAGSSSPGGTGMSGATGGASGSDMKSGAKSDDKGQMKSRARMSRGTGNTEQVKAAQQALKDKGHDPGPVDGVMGPKTRDAVKEFQKAQGIQETGRLDAETMSKLGMQARSSAADTGTPAASPATGSTGRTGSSGPAGGATSTEKTETEPGKVMKQRPQAGGAGGGSR
jgi:peptidoglycan hydrolase-like protein with peptidoglycan-binding domain